MPRALSPFRSLRARRALEADLDPATGAVTGGGGGATVVTHIAQRNLGQPVVGEDLIIAGPVTIEAAGFALVEITSYLELTNEGGWWTPGVIDNGSTVFGDDDAPIAGTVGLAADVFGYVSFNSRGIMVGFAPDAPLAPPNGRGAHAGEAMALSQSLAGTGNLVTLPDGTHDLSLAVAADINDGAHGPGSPDVVTRNVVFSVRQVG